MSTNGLDQGKVDAFAERMVGALNEGALAMMCSIGHRTRITTFDAIHDQARPARVLRNIGRALKPGGVYFAQDIAASSDVERNLSHPLAPFLYTLSTTHCMTVSLAYGGEGPGTMWGKEKALELLAEAGFARTEVRQLPHGIFNYYYISTGG